MKHVSSILIGLAGLAALVFVLSFAVSAGLGAGAQLVQLIEPQDAASAALFGDAPTGEPAGTRIGSPQWMVIRDQRAFLGGVGPGGERFVNAAYLREQNTYPLQVKTITFIRDLVALGSGVAVVMLGLIWWWRERRVRRLLT
jgi:hypothetical protein